MPKRRKKPGPKPAAGVARTVIFGVRLTPGERKRLAARARAAGLVPGDFVRAAALGSKAKKKGDKA